MVYLYAGLGIAMLSGIMAIFEMGLAITGQSFFRNESTYHGSNYFKNSEVRNNDIDFMNDLTDQEWKKEFTKADPPVTIECSNFLGVSKFGWRKVTAGRFKNSGNICSAYSDGRRILVDIDTEKVVYICIPKSSLCSFEEESES
jgi:hypothetical protein